MTLGREEGVWGRDEFDTPNWQLGGDDIDRADPLCAAVEDFDEDDFDDDFDDDFEEEWEDDLDEDDEFGDDDDDGTGGFFAEEE